MRERLLLVMILASSALCQTKQLTAREYYVELYNAGGLDNFADQYVCFREDEIPTFFLLAESAALKEVFTASRISELSRDQQKMLEKGFLIVRGYHKGIAQSEREFFDPDNHGGWIEKLLVSQTQKERQELTVRLQVNWDTLRYTRSVSETAMGLPEYSESGKCETVKPDIHQHGAPETKNKVRH